MKRRYLSPEEKMAIALAGLKGEQSVAEICRQRQISQFQYYKWRDRFLEGGKNALAAERIFEQKLYQNYCQEAA